jgi:hypothetical protein
LLGDHPLTIQQRSAAAKKSNFANNIA